MSEKNRGRFFVLEGIDGAGKTTQAAYLEEYLRGQGRQVLRTAEPTSFPTGLELRRALSGAEPRTECEMATLFVLDRIAHNVHPTEGIEAILDRGIDLICDRYYYSTLAYQGQSTSYRWVKGMNLDCPQIRRPDLCIYLDLTPEQSLERIRAGREQVEIYENLQTLTEVRASFLRVLEDLKERDRIVILDAYRTPREIAADVIAAAEAI